MSFWPVLIRSPSESVGRWAPPFVQVNRFWVSSFPLPLLLHQPISRESLISGIVIFLWDHFAVCNQQARRQELVPPSLPVLQAGRPAWTKVVSSRKKKKPYQVPTGHRSNLLCFSTFWKIRFIECQALCFSPNASWRQLLFDLFQLEGSILSQRSRSWPWSQTALGFVLHAVTSGKLLYF